MTTTYANDIYRILSSFTIQFSLTVLYNKDRFPNLLKLRLIPDLWNSVLHLFLEFHFAKCDDECKNLMIVGVNGCSTAARWLPLLKWIRTAWQMICVNPHSKKNSDFAKIITRKRHRFRVTRIVASVSLILRLDRNKTVIWNWFRFFEINFGL